MNAVSGALAVFTEKNYKKNNKCDDFSFQISRLLFVPHSVCVIISQDNKDLKYTYYLVYPNYNSPTPNAQNLVQS